MVEKNFNTLKNQVYDALFSDIINGVTPADTILTEKFLMEKYNVSRAPIREALTQLAGIHIVSSIPRQGYKILQPNRQQLLEITKFRSALECSFLKSYCIYIDESWIKELRTICMDYVNCPANDFMTHWHHNCQFHLKLFSIYGNHYAYKLLEDALNIQTIFFVQKKYPTTMDLHLALIDYLAKGEIATAVTILKADIENLLLPAIAPTPIDKDREVLNL
ncbi:GntR family transcriptional regulator [Clostridium estertheticum]|uniref:GntR family transcriptional regulator n=1 Tax=Clostridium estertheticum TaxID=238834 RepID=UPI001CF3CFC5|nr:GntR family transcriptional regulator [Clostridium estertheticum]MCB2306258.1 GntR family transcriptional regulator [Clostridium estertheticum]MCB2344431.1 GntR family transcriptional regulator [Clostridium estertheticum]MCB2349350.1 GntR family transcriptional regulator [Clostridium estertheticum]WAG45094.1 GntR family transcriptional regulator [Clostridium estertheticum]